MIKMVTFVLRIFWHNKTNFILNKAYSTRYSGLLQATAAQRVTSQGEGGISQKNSGYRQLSQEWEGWTAYKSLDGI